MLVHEILFGQTGTQKMQRKSTNLKGSYLNLSLNNELGMMIVKDVSMGGIGFEAIGGLRIKKEHELMVTFTLDETFFGH